MNHLTCILALLFTTLWFGAAQVEPDRTVLLKLYATTGGSSWISKWNTTAATLCSGTTTVECWTNGKVRRLKLGGNNLSGTLPTEIGLLTSLETLTISKNSLSGTLPTQLGLLPSLNSLTASSNQLYGPIPTELGLLKLPLIYLDNNLFSGTIPTQISNHPTSTVLRLTNNLLTGPLPSVWSSLFTDIQLDFNQLTGTIPPSIFTPNTVRLRLQGNQLTGSIPTQVGSSTSLNQLYVFLNSLSGSIPTQLAAIPSFERLWAYGNNLTGSIPKEFGSSPSLIDLRIQSNSLSGSIPTQIAQSKTLQALWISDNSLSGELPTQLGSITSLLTIRLAGNQFVGNVPGPLLRLPNLSLLQLSKNCLAPVEPYSSISTNDYSGFEVAASCAQGGPYPQGALALSPLAAYQFSSTSPLADSGNALNNLVVVDPGTIYQSLPFGQYKNPRNTAVQVQVTSGFAFRTKSRLAVSSAYTVEFLFIANNLASTNDLFAFSSGSSTTFSLVLRTNADGSLSLLGSNSAILLQSPAGVLVPTRVNHVALAFSSTRVMTLFVNGIQRNQVTLGSTSGASGNYFLFLSRNSAMALDEVAVYGSALTPATISDRVASLNWCPTSACPGSCTPILSGSSCS